MSGEPWWIERVVALLEPDSLGALSLGPLWNLSQRIEFVRENVQLPELAADLVARPHARALWSALGEREVAVRFALEVMAEKLAGRLRRQELGVLEFRTIWEGLGFVPNAWGGGTPADDCLDALFHTPRVTTGEARPEFGTLNMASRAERVADFLAVTRPGEGDVVFDLGSGNGKLALTVAASTFTDVWGVEQGAAYVAAATRSAQTLGLGNAHFVHADVRDVDLSKGSIFYLYYPFHGEVARAVAERLGRLGQTRSITVYASGPLNDFGEHFLSWVERGVLELSERRGQFEEVLVLRS